MTKDNIIKAIKEGNFDRILLETAKNNFEAGKQNTLKQVRDKIVKWFVEEGLTDSMGQIKLDELLKTLGGDN